MLISFVSLFPQQAHCSIWTRKPFQVQEILEGCVSHKGSRPREQMQVCQPKRQEVPDLLPSRKSSQVSRNAFALQFSGQPPGLLPDVCLLLLERIAEMLRVKVSLKRPLLKCISLCVLTGPKTLWRRPGKTIREGKAVPNLTRSVSISSCWRD